MVGLALLDQARKAGLEVRVNGDLLVLRGPRSAESLARDLLGHKDQVRAMLRLRERSEYNGTLRDELAILRARCGRLNARLDAGCAFLTDLAERIGQESSEYDHYFIEWEKLLHEYQAACDRMDCLELTEKIRPKETKTCHSQK
jgi:hypothetical protein